MTIQEAEDNLERLDREYTNACMCGDEDILLIWDEWVEAKRILDELRRQPCESS